MPSGRIISTDIGVEIAGREILDDANDKPTDHRARDRIEPAQDHHRKHFETDESKLVVDAKHRAPDHPAQRRDDPGHRPGQRKIAPDIDTHRHRNLLAVGDSAHRNPGAALQEEICETRKENEADRGTDQLHRRQHDGS